MGRLTLFLESFGVEEVILLEVVSEGGEAEVGDLQVVKVDGGVLVVDEDSIWQKPVKLIEEAECNDSSGTIDRAIEKVGFRSPTPPSERILRMGFLICRHRGNGELVLILLHLSVN